LFTIYQEPFWINAVSSQFEGLLPFYFACELVGVDNETTERLVSVLEGKTITFPLKGTKDTFKYAFVYWRIVSAIPEMFPEYSYYQRHELRRRALREVCNRFEINEDEVTKSYRDFLIKNGLQAVCVCGNHFSVNKRSAIVNCPECKNLKKMAKK